MTELELVGYTADMQYLVLSDPEQRGSRWHVPIDEDFLNTVEELVQDDPRPARESEAEWANGSVSAAVAGSGPLAAVAAAAGERGLATSDGERPPSSAPSSRLSPRQIQALLRAGKSPRSVAKQAETQEAWVRRWLPPIESERSQVLQAVWASQVTKSRLGRSHDLLGEAVRKNLSAKGVDPEGDTVRWSATRKEGATAWSVTLRYRSRGSTQRAVWRFDPERNLLEPRNQLAVDVAWTRPRQGTGQETAATKAGDNEAGSKKAAAKKSAGKKDAAQKSAGKKSAARKGAGKKSAGKKGAAKKSAGKKGAGKKAPGTEPAVKKAAGKKAPGTEPAAKKAAGKKSTAKKSAGKKAATTKSAGKEAAAKKSTAKKSTTKAAAKKSTTKAGGKKAATKKSTTKKAAGKKTATKKTATKKSATRRRASTDVTDASERPRRG